MNWGILGAGSISHKFATGLAKSATGQLVAGGSRSVDKAREFAAKHGGQPMSYEQVLGDPRVDIVYIALPHHLHGEWTIRCAEAGKHILCEKPFTLDAAEAERALDAVRKTGVFFMEAFMYRCHPQTVELKRLVQSGVIGEPKVVNAEFGFAAGHDWQNFRTDRKLGGGGLMDVGTYCVSMSRMIAGEEPERCEYAAFFGQGGYDEHGTGCMIFPSGLAAMIGTGIHVSLRNEVLIYGTEGHIRVPSPWFCGEAIEVHRAGSSTPEFVRVGEGLDLYGQEADACSEFLEARECPHMTWQDTLDNMRALDRMRQSAGLSFGGA